MTLWRAFCIIQVGMSLIIEAARRYTESAVKTSAKAHERLEEDRQARPIFAGIHRDGLAILEAEEPPGPSNLFERFRAGFSPTRPRRVNTTFREEGQQPIVIDLTQGDSPRTICIGTAVEELVVSMNSRGEVDNYFVKEFSGGSWKSTKRIEHPLAEAQEWREVMDIIQQHHPVPQGARPVPR